MLASFPDPFGQLLHPLYTAVAGLLATFYAIIPNYGAAIALLTFAATLVTFPMTLRAGRSARRMQRLAPEVSRLHERYRVAPTASVEERRSLRARRAEEVAALYRQNGVSPAAGCAPLLVQLPVFWILNGTVRGLTHLDAQRKAAPLYLAAKSGMAEAIVRAHGAMWSFGINLADSLRTAGLSWGGRAPYLLLITVAVVLQYFQMWQLQRRSVALTPGTPQARRIQRAVPLLSAAIYLALPAAVNLYFVVSSLSRLLQQMIIHRV